MADANWNAISFENYATTTIFLFQLITFDNWGERLLSMRSSETYSSLYLIIFAIPLVLSMIINGFIVATFLDEIIGFKKKDVVCFDLVLSPERLPANDEL